MVCFIVGADIDEGWMAPLRRLADGLSPPVTALPDLDTLRADPAFLDGVRSLVLLPDRTPGGPLAESAISFATAETHRAFLVYIADAVPAETYKQLVKTRSAEWITWGALARELPELVRGLTAGHASEGGAKVVSCVPTKGGVGNTTLAIEIAAHLAARRKRSGTRVAVLDLDVHGGTLADCLDVEPRLDFGELSGRPERLDEQLIDIFTSRHSARLDVFASPPGRAEAGTAEPATVFAFLDAIGSRYDLLVLDIPHRGPPWLDNILQGSDAVVVAGGPTVPALRQATAKLAHLDAIPVKPDRIAVAVNQCQADLLGRIGHQAEIARALAGRRTVYIRRDTATVDGAHDSGRPVLEVAPGKGVSKDIGRLVDWVEGLVGGAEPRAVAMPSRGRAA